MHCTSWEDSAFFFESSSKCSPHTWTHSWCLVPQFRCRKVQEIRHEAQRHVLYDHTVQGHLLIPSYALVQQLLWNFNVWNFTLCMTDQTNNESLLGPATCCHFLVIFQLHVISRLKIGQPWFMLPTWNQTKFLQQFAKLVSVGHLVESYITYLDF